MAPNPRRAFRPHRKPWILILALIPLAAALGGCGWGRNGREAGPGGIAQRRTASLERLVQASAGGRVVPFDHAMVRIDQRLIQSLLRASMPLDYGVGGQFRILIDSAQVNFQDGLALVRLGGGVRSLGAASGEPFARVTFDAELKVLEFDPALHNLRCRLYLLDFTLDATGPAGASKDLIERLGRFGLDALGPSALTLPIPIQVDPQIRLPEVGPSGEIRIQPAVVPLRIAVTAVTAWRGRLWISLLVRVAAPGAADSLHAPVDSSTIRPSTPPFWKRLVHARQDQDYIQKLRDTLDLRVSRDSLLLPIVRDSGDVVLAVRQGLVRELLEEATTRYLRHVELDIGSNLQIHEGGELSAKTPFGQAHAGDWLVHITFKRLQAILSAAPPRLTVQNGNRVHMVVPATIHQGEGAATLDFTWHPTALASMVCRGFTFSEKIEGVVMPNTYDLVGDFNVFARGGAIVAEPVVSVQKYPLMLDLTPDSWARARHALVEQDKLLRCGLFMNPENVMQKLHRLAAVGIKVRLPHVIFQRVEFPASLTRFVQTGGRWMEIVAIPNELRVTSQAFWYSANVSADPSLRPPPPPGTLPSGAVRQDSLPQ